MSHLSTDNDHSYLCRNRKITSIMTQRARSLRREATVAEIILWQVLRKSQLGVKFRRQHAVKNLILDFYCAELLIAIEVDGSIHLDAEVQQRDTLKNDFFIGMGIKLLRFQNEEVQENIDSVIAQIRQTISERDRELSTINRDTVSQPSL